MLYPITFPSPYLNGVDAETKNTIKFMINPRDVIDFIEISLYKNDNYFGTLRRTYSEADGKLTQHKIWEDINGIIEALEISDEDTMLPISGSYKDEIWFQTILPKNTLTNGENYKWKYSACSNPKKTVVYSTYEHSSYYSITLDYNYNDFIKEYRECITNTEKTEITVFSIPLYLIYKNKTYKINKIYPTDARAKTIIEISPDNYPSLSEGNNIIVCSKYDFPQEYFFTANETPDIIYEVPEVIDSSGIYVKASCSNQNISFYKYDLYKKAELVYSTDEIYTSSMEFDYVGLENGYNYSLILTIEDDYKRKFTFEKDFEVKYEVLDVLSAPKLSLNKQDGCIDIDITPSMQIPGFLEGSQSVNLQQFSSGVGFLRLDNQNIYWNQSNGNDLKIPIESTIVLHWHVSPGFTGKILDLTSDENPLLDTHIWYSSGNIYYRIGNKETQVESLYDTSASAIFATEDELPTEGNTTYYYISGDDEISGGDILYANDILSKNWWHIIVEPNKIEFIQSIKVEEAT